MKKSKLLMPILTVAGLGAAITPIAMLTSCNCGGDHELEAIKLDFIDVSWYSNEIKSEWEANKTYSCLFSVEDGQKFSSFSIKHYKDGSAETCDGELTSFQIYKKDGSDLKEVVVTRLASKEGKAEALFNSISVNGNYVIKFELKNPISSTNDDPSWIAVS